MTGERLPLTHRPTGLASRAVHGERRRRRHDQTLTIDGGRLAV
jgi:hypothetical protein